MLEVTQSPFPHLDLQDVFAPGLLRKCVAEIAKYPADGWKTWINGNEIKNQGSFAMAGPSIRTLRDALYSHRWISKLEKAFGIKGLVPDDEGGGIHWIPTGGLLNMHIDGNRSTQKPGLYRRLNCLVYANEDWRPEDGGALKLAIAKDAEPEAVIHPVFGKVAVFETSEHSWHGHPDPLLRGNRYSFAVYYYAKDKHPGYGGDHTTVFK